MAKVVQQLDLEHSFKKLSPTELEQVYQTATSLKRNMTTPDLQVWIWQTFNVWIAKATLRQWRAGTSRPTPLYWPAVGHQTPDHRRRVRELYEEVRAGERKRFPNGFWTGPGGRERAAELIRYLVESYGFAFEDRVRHLTKQFLKQEQLSGALRLYGSVSQLLRAAYPDRWAVTKIQRILATRSCSHNPQRLLKRAKARLKEWGVSEVELQASWPHLYRAGKWLATVRGSGLKTTTFTKLFLALLRLKHSQNAVSYHQVLSASGYSDKEIYRLQKQLVLGGILQDNPRVKRHHFVMQARSSLETTSLPEDLLASALEVLSQIATHHAIQAFRKPTTLAAVVLKIAAQQIGTPMPTNQVIQLVGASYLPPKAVKAVIQALNAPSFHSKYSGLQLKASE